MTPFLQVLERNGGDDETRTRGLCRDSERLTSIFNDFENADGIASQHKYVLSKDIVYHKVYHPFSVTAIKGPKVFWVVDICLFSPQ
jgi:hypothetical protein